MPLKHFTETFLVVVLGAVIALTGMLTATLPSLPDGALPWAVLFVLSVVYPLSLHSLFQRRRADNLFRNLHWFPAAIVLVWLVLEGVRMSISADETFFSLYTWSWTIVPVVLGFVLLVAFCLKVIRRRTPRLAFLALILIPFSAAAFVSEQSGKHWERELASVLWSADFWSLDKDGLLAGLTAFDEPADEKNLEPSEDPHEESWRERLRMQKSREERIAARLEQREEPSEDSASSTMSAMSSKGRELAGMSSKPSNLPKSGFGWNIILVTMAGAYCAALHQRARKRV